MRLAISAGASPRLEGCCVAAEQGLHGEVDLRLIRLELGDLGGPGLACLVDVFAHGLAVEPSRRAMADTHNPCRCRSRITTTSLSLTTTALPRTAEGNGDPMPGAYPTPSVQAPTAAKLGNFKRPI